MQLIGLTSPAAELSIFWLSAASALGLAIIHIYAGKLKFLDVIPRSRWLSAASGVSVAYVFVHLLPDLNEQQAAIADSGFVGFVEHHVYLISLFGLTVFYGLERLVRTSEEKQEAKNQPKDMGVFWIHMASFSAYNALIGYLLVHREKVGLLNLLFYFIAMGLHFLVNDFGLRADHQHTYHRLGRWILAAAIVVGWAIGVATKINDAAIAVLFAFLAGGIILNVLKEELPEERQSQFGAFATGTAIYTLLLLAL